MVFITIYPKKDDYINIPNVICQQIVQNHTIAKGLHVNTSIDFCDCMIAHYENLLLQVENGKHISFSKYVEDIEDLKQHLLQKYTRTLKMYRTTLINLIHSKN